MNSIVTPPGWDNVDSAHRIEFLIDCVRDKKHIPFVEPWFKSIGPCLIVLLVYEIIDSKKSPTHRAGLVELIGATGGSLSLLHAETLVNHPLCQCRTVRDSVTSLIAKLEAEGKTLEGNPPGWRCPGGPEALIRLLEGKLPEGTHERSNK